jgi:RIP metalloprotease RseP
MCFGVWVGVVGQPDSHSPLISEVNAELEGTPSPAAGAGLRADDRIVAIGGIEDPTDVQLVAYTREHVGQPVTLTIERDGERFDVTLVPVLSEVDGEQVGRIGVILSEARETAGLAGMITGGATLTWDALVRTVQNIGHVFGPEGIGRVVHELFTSEPRDPSGPSSVVGIARLAGQTASRGNPGDLLYIFAVINVFIGFLNLLPLPPFDGGHLAVLAIEKVRGKKVDMRKVVPVSIAVLAFFALFTLSVIYLDIVKPSPLFSP